MVDLTAEEVKQAAKDRADREAGVRASLNAEAERVMNESKPTPTQAEMDAIKRGEMHHDDKVDPENPDMPSLHEQRQRIAEAGGEHAAYRTRSMTSKRDADRNPPGVRTMSMSGPVNPEKKRDQ
jgi:hypothetical protein